MGKVLEVEARHRFLIENIGSFNVLNPLDNSGRTPVQRLLAILLRFEMLTLAEGKATHWFDWKDLKNPEKYEGINIPGDPTAFDLNSKNPFIKRLNHVRMSLGGWKMTYLIGPDPELADLGRLRKTGWLYAFRILGSDGEILKAQRSQIVNQGISSTLILRGRRNFDAIGLYPNTFEEVPLVGVASIRRGMIIQ